MTTENSAPRGFSEWLEHLQERSIGPAFDTSAGSLLRVITGARESAVILATGTGVIPYMDWVLDGMSMSSRLILHNRSATVVDMIQSHFSADIRVAVHQQDLSAFLADIERHRFDFIVVDLDDTDAGPLSTMIERLSEHGLFICTGSAVAMANLVDSVKDSHFCAMAANDGFAVLSRKSLQHRAVRRGGRRRHGHRARTLIAD